MLVASMKSISDYIDTERVVSLFLNADKSDSLL